ncbi:MAG TPA: DUF6583 family protein [Cerasibacillus sp.]|uniref:DUF6583 family protein n=1 Tax=Cerasibacillus sp. TaxID=2498711 RepID=UPI002F420032
MEQPKKAMEKKSLFAIALVALIAVGGVLVYFMLNTSPKQKYFEAEMASYNVMEDAMKTRFTSEVKWDEMSRKYPMETELELSGEMNIPFDEGSFDDLAMSQIINNAKLNGTLQTDMDKKIITADLSANVAGMTFKDFTFLMDAEKLQVGMPFIDDVLQVKAKDLEELLREEGELGEDEELDFERFFEPGFITEEDRKHFQKEYIDFLYNEISDEAFTEEKDTVSVDGKDVKANKITFHLDEKEFQRLLKETLEKLQKDETLRRIIKDSIIKDEFIGSSSEMLDFDADLNDMFTEMINSIDSIKLPDGMKSMIWINKDIIVKRDFKMTTLDEFDEKITISIEGTQSLTKDKQTFDYAFKGSDALGEGGINIKGDLSLEKDKVKDHVTFAVDDMTMLEYKSDETLTKKDHKFEREIIASDGFETFKIGWNGDSKFEGDTIKSDYSFAFNTSGLDLFTLNLVTDGKKIKKVENVHDGKVKDIGGMDEDELEEYFSELEWQFNEWMFDF